MKKLTLLPLDGTSILEILTGVFGALKLTGYITWSWWWVFSPLWIPFLILVFTLVVVIIFEEITDRFFTKP